MSVARTIEISKWRAGNYSLWKEWLEFEIGVSLGSLGELERT